ncbi:heat shock protein 67B1 [Xyrauchen texanus]|uniref:heat shock protein 67B1 n=1 Tax=Xyrauchen texanus TaxID=154827 RepID=UPI002242914B|nr:heat shock protein 67B1 [Xyrauchen texanus]
MADAMKSSSRPQYCQEVSWYPQSYRWPSVIFNQHFGLAPLLNPRDLSWIEDIIRRLGTSAWPGYLRTTVLSPFTQAPGQKISKLHREMSGGMSEVAGETCKWKISLDVNHFAPSEITAKIQGGFLEIAGKHEERQDEHGYIARCFTRKYRLPVGVDAENVQSLVSVDGILTVEAPLISIPFPADVIIPIQVLIGPGSSFIFKHRINLLRKRVEAHTIGGKQQNGDKPQDSVEAEEKPESFETSTVPGEHLEDAQEPEGCPADQKTVSDSTNHEADPSGEPPAQSITEPAPGTLESGRLEVEESRDIIEEGVFQEEVEDIEKAREEVHEFADKPQAQETPDTVISEQAEQAEIIQNEQPLELKGEGYTDPAVTEDEQSTFGQTQEVFDPQLVLQKEMDVAHMKVTK